MRDWLAHCNTYSDTHTHIQQQLVAHTSAEPAETDSVLASLTPVGGGQAVCMCMYIYISSLTRA